MKKEKIFISLVVILMISLVVGNIYSLATENNPVKITANTNTANAANTANKTNTTNEDKNESVSGTVNGTNNVKNNTVNNTSKNTAAKNTTTNSTSLPKAGTDSTVVFLVLGFVASTIYAYKKVSDYNI